VVGFKKLPLGLSVLLASAHLLGQGFDPERDVSVSFRDGAVVLGVPSVAHANGITVALKPGAPGRLSVGALPPPSGRDSLGGGYWTGEIKIRVRGEGLKDPVALVVSYMTCLEGEGGLCFPSADKELRVRAADIPSGAAPGAEAKAPPAVQREPQAAHAPGAGGALAVAGPGAGPLPQKYK